jgi:Caspase domain
MNTSNTCAIILGASSWPLYKDTLVASTAFLESAREFQKYLLSQRGFGLSSQNVLDLFDNPSGPNEILGEISAFLQKQRAVHKGTAAPWDLLVYYTGHGGFVGDQKSYFLAIRTTANSALGASSIRMSDLASVLRSDALGARRYLILDCCFSAAAYTEYQAAPAQAARLQTLESFPRTGTSLLCSSNRRSISVADDGNGRTMFSGALLDILERGDPNLPSDYLSLEEVGTRIQGLIQDKYSDGGVRPEVLSPDQREGNIANLPLFPNSAHRKAATAETNGHAKKPLGQALSLALASLNPLNRGNSTRTTKSSRYKVLAFGSALIILLVSLVLVLFLHSNLDDNTTNKDFQQSLAEARKDGRPYLIQSIVMYVRIDIARDNPHERHTSYRIAYSLRCLRPTQIFDEHFGMRQGQLQRWHGSDPEVDGTDLSSFNVRLPMQPGDIRTVITGTDYVYSLPSSAPRKAFGEIYTLSGERDAITYPNTEDVIYEITILLDMPQSAVGPGRFVIALRDNGNKISTPVVLTPTDDSNDRISLSARWTNVYPGEEVGIMFGE